MARAVPKPASKPATTPAGPARKPPTRRAGTGRFLMKSEPFKYSWDQLVRDGSTTWEGVRNYESRNTLRAMSPGDLALFYHSNEGKDVVGVCKVIRAAYPDPTATPDDPDWSVVDVAPVCALKKPVSLEVIKAEPRLKDIALVRRSRLSVVPLTDEEFSVVLELGQTRVPTRTRKRA